MKLESVVRKDVSYVEFLKDESNPLGIVLRDGTQNEEGPVIKRVKPKSMAERSHAIAKGDIILALNRRNTVGTRSKDVRHMLKQFGPSISLKLKYEIREACISCVGGASRTQQMTVRLQKEGNSFGFILRKKDLTNPFTTMEYPVISNIKQGSLAEWYGSIQDGDRLLKVDDVSLSWLSLADIVDILLERVNAEFTFEYDVKVIDLSTNPDKKINLEIEVVNVDLGIGLCSYSSESSGICIDSIQPGSVAKRCGIFFEGDIILSVNGIDVRELTVSKANALLQCVTRSRKISFISSRKVESESSTLIGQHSSLQGKYAHTYVNLVEAFASDNQHLNTPQSANTTLSVKRKIQSGKFCYKEQAKVIKGFHNIVKHMNDLKQSLSRLTREAFKSKENIPLENCTACCKSHHSVKLCVSCLSKMNVKCVQSIDFLKHIIANYIDISLTQINSPLSNTWPKEVGDDNTKRRVPTKVIETLPKVFAGKLNTTKPFETLGEELVKANVSCTTCKNRIDYISLTVKKLLLLISLNDPSTEVKQLIDQLVYCLLDKNLTCDCSESSVDDEISITESETASLPLLFPSRETEMFPKRTENIKRSISDTKLNTTILDETESSTENSLKIPTLSVNLNQHLAYYKLTEISEIEDFSECERSETLELNKNVPKALEVGEKVTYSGTNCLEETSVSKESNCSTGNNKDADKNIGLLNAHEKICKSLDTFLKPKQSFQSSVQSVVRNECFQASNLEARNLCQELPRRHLINSVQPLPAPLDANDDSGGNVFTLSSLQSIVQDECPQTFNPGGQNLNKELPRNSVINSFQSLSVPPDENYHSGGNTLSVSHSTQESTNPSSTDPVKNVKSKQKPKTHTETVEVKLVNDGGGFGFVLGFSSPNFYDTLPVPIVTAIKPKSPARKIGVLAKRDRILTINKQSVVGIPLKDLEKLKRTVFEADSINLTVEFDVNDVEVKFGNFDVELDKSLKVGLLFEDIRKGYPMVVSGVVKGSAAHRSGQLFPGDRITLLKSVRKEEFDPSTCSYNKEEMVQVSVLRNLAEDFKERPKQSYPTSTNPFSYNPGSSQQTGSNYIVKRTSVRAAGGTDALVLDQEVTLFRDPISWDFGFLVGENPETGRAYITEVKPGGPASASGVMRKMDRIVEVNGVVIGKTEDCSVLSLLTQANDKVDLLIRRLYREEANGAVTKPQTFKPPSFM